MSKRKRIAVAALVAAGVFALWRGFARPGGSDKELRVSGVIEVTSVEVGFKIPGRVEKRLVDEGATVRAGALVAVLDTADLERALAVSRSDLQVAEAALAEIEAPARKEEVAAAEAVVRRAKADLDRLASELKRTTDLAGREAVSVQEKELVQSQHDAAKATVAEAEARLSLLRAGAREETKAVARARVQQAKAAVALAEQSLANASARAPVSGFVLSKNVEAGEVVAAGTPVVTVGDLSRVWLKAYVSETDLGRVKLEQRVRVTTDTYPGKAYEGRIGFLSSEAEFTPKDIQTEKERVKLVYRVKIFLENPGQELKPGMPADAVILLEGK